MAKKSLFWFVTMLLILIAGYVMTTTVIMPVVTKNLLPEAIIPKEKAEKNINKPEKKVKNGKKQEAIIQPRIVEQGELAGSKDELRQLIELRKSEILLRSRYKLSTEDSCYMMLDFKDKTARLELKGVLLYQCKIGKYSISNSISKFHTETLLRWMAQPFAMKSVLSTITRVPIAIVNAPKDTTEANMKEATPTAPKREDVHIVMNFERNLQLVIQQEELTEGEGKMKVDSLKSSFVQKEINRSLKSLTTFKREPATPQIVINISKADATIIFRALPQKPKMVLRM